MRFSHFSHNWFLTSMQQKSLLAIWAILVLIKNAWACIGGNVNPRLNELQAKDDPSESGKFTYIQIADCNRTARLWTFSRHGWALSFMLWHLWVWRRRRSDVYIWRRYSISEIAVTVFPVKHKILGQLFSGAFRVRRKIIDFLAIRRLYSLARELKCFTSWVFKKVYFPSLQTRRSEHVDS